jgi:threonyl-tRNA synthetase
VHRIGRDIKFEKNPAYIAERKSLFNELYEKQKEKYAGNLSFNNVFVAFSHEKITITLPDGKQKEGVAFETTPMDIVKGISNSLAKEVVVAKVNFTRRVATLDEGLLNPEAESNEENKEQWILYDLLRPLEGDC